MARDAAPVIGLTVFPRPLADEPGHAVDGVDHRYVAAVERAGGIPLLLPVAATSQVERLIERLDGLILTGGGDVHSRCYGQAPYQLHGVLPERDDFEIALVHAARRTGLPLLGICRGMQVLNVALGGDLLQDLGSLAAEHRSGELDQPCHTVEVLPGTALTGHVPLAVLGVNSQHHQAVDTLGADLRACAVGPAGVIEAIESVTGWWALGVQWHPEAIPVQPGSSQLFAAFVAAATARAVVGT